MIRWCHFSGPRKATVLLAGLITCLCVSSIHAFTQSRVWVLPHNVVDFTTSPPTVTAWGDPYVLVSNGAYDSDGRLLFSVGYSYSTNTFYVDTGTNTYALFTSWVDAEVHVVPVPGDCDSFFVIAYIKNGTGPNWYGQLAWRPITVDRATGALAVGPGGLAGHYTQIDGAVSAISRPDASGSTRFLYLGVAGLLDRYEINSTGLTGPTTIDAAGTAMCYQMSLSSDGTKLAAGANGGVIVWTLDPIHGTVIGSPVTLYNLCGSTAEGVEFSPSGRYLFTTPCFGYYDMGQSSPPWTDFNNTGAYGNGQLDLGFDGKIYISDGTNLGAIANPDAPSPNSFTQNVISNVPIPGVWNTYYQNSFFPLPDQVIGDDYDLMLADCSRCGTPPRHLVGWWPLDETSGPNAKDLCAGNDGTWVGTHQSNNGWVRNSLSFPYPSSYVQVAPQNTLLNLGTGDFTVEAWIRSTNQDNGVRTIIDKRDIPSSYRGVSLFLYNRKLGAQVGDGAGYNNWVSTTPILTDGLWHQVALAIDRDNPNGGRLYVDNVAVTSFNPTGRQGNISNPATPLRIGDATQDGPTTFKGDIDEVEIFNAALSQAEIASLFHGLSAGQCEESCYLPPRLAMCPGGGNITTDFWICNYSGSSQTYDWSISGASGAGCTAGSPSAFSPPGQTSVAVASGQCKKISITITPPAGFAGLQTTCYKATVTNTTSGNTFTSSGSIQKLRDDIYYGWCVRNNRNDLIASPGQAINTYFEVANQGAQNATFPYEIGSQSVDGDSTNQIVSLNGLPPGTPITGYVQLAPGQTTQIPFNVSLTELQPFNAQALFLRTDEDGDQVKETATSSLVFSRMLNPAGVGDPSPEVAENSRLIAGPNPGSLDSPASLEFRIDSQRFVRVEIYDVSGRLIRSIHSGILPAGPQQFRWDGKSESGQRAPAGIYFIRVSADDRVMTTKLSRLP